MYDTLELIELDSILLSMAEECKCQSTHEPPAEEEYEPDEPESTFCSVKVVARKLATCGAIDILICQNSYEWNLWYMSNTSLYWENDCDGCGRLASDCWIITPI